MESMDIGLLHYSAPPVVGGVESVIAKHAQLMADAGHRVRILAGRGAQFDNGVDFVHIPLIDSTHERVLSVKRDLDRGVVSPGFQLLLEEIHDALEPHVRDLDLLIAHNVCSLHKNLALTAVLKRRADRGAPPRLILWHHDLAWTAPRYRNELHKGYPWDLLRLNWPGVQKVAVSEFRRGELAFIAGLPAEEIEVIPNGISVLDFLEVSKHAREVVETLGLLSAAPLILLPVRVTRRKNIDLALRIVAELRKTLPGAAMVVTGPPGAHNITNQQYLDELRKVRVHLRLEGHAHFLADLSPDFYPDDAIHGLYRLADLLLLPSLEEGFGLPVLEASQAKLPIFCSDIPSLRELAGAWGRFFPPGGPPEDIATEIAHYLATSSIFQLRVQLRALEWTRLYCDRIEPLIRKTLGAKP